MLTVGSPLELLFTNGLIHSHATSPARVTSNRRPLVPSQTSTLPEESREAPEMWPEKNCCEGRPRKVQTISFFAGSISTTLEESWPLSKTRMFPFGSQVGLCWPCTLSNLKLISPVSPEITQTRSQLRAEKTMSPFSFTSMPLMWVHSQRIARGSILSFFGSSNFQVWMRRTSFLSGVTSTRSSPRRRGNLSLGLEKTPRTLLCRSSLTSTHSGTIVLPFAKRWKSWCWKGLTYSQTTFPSQSTSQSVV